MDAKREELLKKLWYNPGDMKPVVEQCTGCAHVDRVYCKSYLIPEAKWRMGDCPRATHLQMVKKIKTVVRVGQQKQKKG